SSRLRSVKSRRHSGVTIARPPPPHTMPPRQRSDKHAKLRRHPWRQHNLITSAFLQQNWLDNGSEARVMECRRQPERYEDLIRGRGTWKGGSDVENWETGMGGERLCGRLSSVVACSWRCGEPGQRGRHQAGGPYLHQYEGGNGRHPSGGADQL